MKFPLPLTRLITRRRFLLGSFISALGVVVYTWRGEPHWVCVTQRDMPVRNLPSEWNGKTLAQISDIHVGPRVDFEYLTSAIQTINELKPDVVAITGDFMSAGNTERIEEVAKLVEYLDVPSLGCFACLGNHDYGDGWKRPELADILCRRLADTGVRVLRNARHEVGGLQIVGLDDLWGTNFHPEKVMKKLKVDEPAIVLSHNPDVADRDVWGEFRGWILSGHTHGGQCKPPFLPPPMLPVKNRLYTAGEFDLGDGRFMYINRGLGHLLRVRFNARPEITLFRLVRA